MKHNQAAFYKDIRYVQIAFMGVLFSYGVLVFDLSLLWTQVVLTFAAGLLTQFFWKKKLYRSGIEKKGNLSRGHFLSAFITCLSLVLLLRSDNLWIHPLASFIAISSKFCIQYNKQHFFNPSAFGIFVVLLLGEAWLSPGQWGSHISLSIWMVAVGCFIVTKVHRMDISWFFLLFYLGGLLIRDLYLGYEMAVFYHAALSGSLLLFAFFMISDPRTSPNHLVGKAIFTFFVAFTSLVLHYYFYIQNGLIYSLVAGSCFVPLLNKKFQARPFQWNKKESGF
ncbi:MAG: RnfABCDGE type electron transport complex subunit D [Bdellovibrionales bacterium]|nr:RnfABCDGE type electron transport complex subunit D [Bdellovibrionales bacterium]